MQFIPLIFKMYPENLYYLLQFHPKKSFTIDENIRSLRELNPLLKIILRVGDSRLLLTTFCFLRLFTCIFIEVLLILDHKFLVFILLIIFLIPVRLNFLMLQVFFLLGNFINKSEDLFTILKNN